MTLWYLATTETFRQTADRFDLARSSSHKLLDKTLDFLISLARNYIKWPSDEEKLTISQGFSINQNIHFE